MHTKAPKEMIKLMKSKYYLNANKDQKQINVNDLSSELTYGFTH